MITPSTPTKFEGNTNNKSGHQSGDVLEEAGRERIHDATPTAVIPSAHPRSQSPFKAVFNNGKAHKKVHKMSIDEKERDREYIAGLEKLLREKGVEIPNDLIELRDSTAESREQSRLKNHVMEDGRLETLTKVIEKQVEHTRRYEIQVQYRHLTFWNELAEKGIPTVGSNLRSLFMMGGGKKRRVNIVKDLTGRILPKRMTLVMGPPGCGEFHIVQCISPLVRFCLMSPFPTLNEQVKPHFSRRSQANSPLEQVILRATFCTTETPPPAENISLARWPPTQMKRNNMLPR